VNITFESNWQKAKQVLTDILNAKTVNFTAEVKEQIKEASNDLLIFYSNFAPIVYTNISKQGVEFNLRYICLPRERRTYDATISEEILNAFAQHDDINFSYPTTRFLDYPNERKDALSKA
jgi:small-conductance mechanosensitive channel